MVAATAAPHAYRPHLPGVESARAYAAFAIVIFHVIHLTQAPVPHSLEFMKWFFGYGVPLFFVVSAFSLAYGYEGKLSSKAQTAEFYLRRVLRIAPLYYLALAAQLISIKAQGHDLPPLGDIALSLGFVFNLSPHMVDGIAPASWSIGVEMLFYAVFPLLLAIATTLPRAILLTIAFSAIAVAYTMIGTRLKVNPSFVVHGLLFNLPYFGFGLVAFQLFGHTPPKLGQALTFGGLALIVAAWSLAPIFAGPGAGVVLNVLYMVVWGAPFGLLCLGMALRPPAVISNPATQFLGKISFGVYLAHPQVIFGLSHLGVYQAIQRVPGGSGVTFPLAVLITSVVVIPLAWALFVFVETPGIQLGRRIARSMGRVRPETVEPSVAA